VTSGAADSETLSCVECGREPRGDQRFKAYLTVDNEIPIYCPECAEREFGPSKRTDRDTFGTP
jgi:hypothetical protein